MSRDTFLMTSFKSASFLAWVALAVAGFVTVCVLTAGSRPHWVSLCDVTSTYVTSGACQRREIGMSELNAFTTTSERDTVVALMVVASVSSIATMSLLLSYMCLPGYRGFYKVMTLSMAATALAAVSLLGALCTVSSSLSRSLTSGTFRYSSCYALACVALVVDVVLFCLQLLELLSSATCTT